MNENQKLQFIASLPKLVKSSCFDCITPPRIWPLCCFAYQDEVAGALLLKDVYSDFRDNWDSRYLS